MVYDVSVVIVNYNTKDMTWECIESIKSHTRDINYEIILVDNASTDGSKEFFTNKKGLMYIYSDKNLGFGQASNLGVSRSKGRNIFFLNSDTILINNAIKYLSDYIDNNKNVGIVGGNLYDRAGDPVQSFESIFPGITYTIDQLTKNLLSRMRFGNNRSFNRTSKPLSVAYIIGADLMISRTLFNQMEGFSSDFFMYYEETDLCYRVKKLKKEIHCIPNSKIIHLEGGSQKKTKTKVSLRKKLESSRKIYMNRNHGKLYIAIDSLLQTVYHGIVDFLTNGKYK